MRAFAYLSALGVLCAAQNAAADDCARPTDPGGFDGYDYGATAVQSFGNSDVLVWYATSGSHAVNPASSRRDRVPDDVALVAQVTSDALASYAQLGYRAPISDATNPACGSNGGDARLDVYLVHMVGADGTTVAEPGRCTKSGAAAQCASFIFAQANFAGYYPTAEIGIRTVIPHELFHAVQNAYDAELDRFWAEGTAQWAAKNLDPTLTDLERFLPAFFSAEGRALDAPPNGVTSAFLYGAAIWPLFLTSRHGDGVVRAIFEQEGESGGASLDATDVVLRSMQSSMALEYLLFAVWNAGTGMRAGDDGYASAATYPMVSLAELDADGAANITSGFASFYFHVNTSAQTTIALETDPARNAGMLLPLADGHAQIDKAVPLPGQLDGEGIVVVSGISSKKTDAPFRVTLTPTAQASDAGADAAQTAAPHASSGGCAVTARSGSPNGSLVFIFFMALARRRRHARSAAR